MIQRRLIPVLLLKNNLLYKSLKFTNYQYIGDPINTIKILNDKEVDELVILDIEASKMNRAPNYKLLNAMASEAFMPIAYGGGVTNLNIAKQVIQCGVEKVVLNTALLQNANLVNDIVAHLGTPSVVASIDIKKSFLGKYQIYNHTVGEVVKKEIKAYISDLQKHGIGEILLTSVDQDGLMKGYDIELCRNIVQGIKVPMIVCGGAGRLDHIGELFREVAGVSAAAGSFFVFYGKHRAVLITYPQFSEIDRLLKIKNKRI